MSESDLKPSLEDLAAMLLARDGEVGMPEAVVVAYTWQDTNGKSQKAFHFSGNGITLMGLVEWSRIEIEMAVQDDDEEGD